MSCIPYYVSIKLIITLLFIYANVLYIMIDFYEANKDFIIIIIVLDLK